MSACLYHWEPSDSCVVCLRLERDRLRAELASANTLLDEALITMRHASTFIRSREKMHPTGIDLWNALIVQIARHREPDKVRRAGL